MAEGGYDDGKIPAKLDLDPVTGEYVTEFIDEVTNQRGKVKMDVDVKVNGTTTKPKVYSEDETRARNSGGKTSTDDKVTIDLKFRINVKNGKTKTTIMQADVEPKDGDTEDSDTEVEDEQKDEHRAKRSAERKLRRQEAEIELPDGATGGARDGDLADHSDVASTPRGNCRSPVEFPQNRFRDRHHLHPPDDHSKKLLGYLSGHDSGIHDLTATEKGDSTLAEETDGILTPRQEDSHQEDNATGNLQSGRLVARSRSEEEKLEREKQKKLSQSQIRRNRAQKLKQALERESNGGATRPTFKRRASVAEFQRQPVPASRFPRRTSFAHTGLKLSQISDDSSEEETIKDSLSREHLEMFIMLYKLKTFLNQHFGKKRGRDDRNEAAGENSGADRLREETEVEMLSDCDESTGLIGTAIINVVHSQTGRLKNNFPDEPSSAAKRDPETSTNKQTDNNVYLTSGLLNPSQTTVNIKPGETAVSNGGRVRTSSFRETLEHFIAHGDDPEVQKAPNPSVMETVGSIINSASGGAATGRPLKSVSAEDDVFEADRPSLEIRKKMSNYDGTAERIRRETVDVDRHGKSKAELIFSEPEDIANIDPLALGIDLKEGEELKFMEVIVVDAEDVDGIPTNAPKPRVFQPIGILPYSNENEALVDKEIRELSENAGFMVSSSPLNTRSLPGSPKLNCKSFNIMRKISSSDYDPRGLDAHTPPRSPLARRAFSTAEAPPRSPRTSPGGRKTSTVDFYKKFYGNTKRQLETAKPEPCTPIEKAHGGVLDKLESLQFQKAMRGETLEGLGCLHRGNAGFYKGSMSTSSAEDDQLSTTSNDSRVFVFPERENRSRSRSNESEVSTTSEQQLSQSPPKERRFGDARSPEQLRPTDKFIQLAAGRRTKSTTDAPISPESIQKQTLSVRESPPILRGLRKFSPNEPDVSKLRQQRLGKHVGPVTPREDFSDTEIELKRNSGELRSPGGIRVVRQPRTSQSSCPSDPEYENEAMEDLNQENDLDSRVRSISLGGRSPLSSGRQLQRQDSNQSSEELEDEFGSLGEDLDMNGKPKPRRIAVFTGEDWILKTKQQVDAMPINDPAIKMQVSSTQSKNLQSPPEENNVTATATSGGPSVDIVDGARTKHNSTNSNTNHAPKTVNSKKSTNADSRTTNTNIRNAKTDNTEALNARSELPFRNYIPLSERSHDSTFSDADLDSLSGTPFSSPRMSPTFNRRQFAVPQLKLTPINDSSRDNCYQKYNSRSETMSAKKIPQQQTSEQTQTNGKTVPKPSPFRSYKSLLEFENLSNKKSEPKTVNGNVEKSRRVSAPARSANSYQKFEPVRTQTTPSRGKSTADKGSRQPDGSSGLLSPRNQKSNFESISSVDSGFGSIRPDRLDSTYSDVFRMEPEGESTDENLRISDYRLIPSPRDETGGKNQVTADKMNGGATSQCNGGNTIPADGGDITEFNDIMNKLLVEEDYQSDDEALRQKCLDVFKTAHHRDTVYSEFRKLIRFKRRNSIQKSGPMKAFHRMSSSGSMGGAGNRTSGDESNSGDEVRHPNAGLKS